VLGIVKRVKVARWEKMQDRASYCLVAGVRETKISQSSGPMRDAEGGYAPARTPAARGQAKGGDCSSTACLVVDQLVHSRSFQTPSSALVSLSDSSQQGHQTTLLTQASLNREHDASVGFAEPPFAIPRADPRHPPHILRQIISVKLYNRH
jgi:hypothetical protein